MISDIQRNPTHYSALALLCALFGLLFLRNLHNNTNLFAILSIFSIIYVVWGILHHFFNKNLKFKIVLEYLLIAGLSVLLSSTLLL